MALGQVIECKFLVRMPQARITAVCELLHEVPHGSRVVGERR